jgi:biotin carboxyl carrier protein
VVTGAGDPVGAPLPGTVVDIKVTQGQAVKSGDLIAIIEAMKMENEVLAPKDGTVTQVVASKGSAVKTGDPLVMLG